MKKSNLLTAALHSASELAPQRTFIGVVTPDKNVRGNLLLAQGEKIYSFRPKDIEAEEKLSGGMVRFRLREGCTGIVSQAFRVPRDGPEILSNLDPHFVPTVLSAKARLRLASAKDVAKLRTTTPADQSLADVAAHWSDSCACGDAETNNCAHFLSDAFIRAGYSDLKKSSANVNIHEWCDWNDAQKTPDARPIRAKEMWKWFESMAQKKIVLINKPKPNEIGFWAVFQWDKSYSGGHVLLYDFDNQKAYGTGEYWTWSDQYYYRW